MSIYLKRLSLLIFLPSFLISCTEPANDPGTDATPPSSIVAIKGAKAPSIQDIEKSLFTNPALNFDKIVATNPDVFSLPGEVSGVGSAEQEALKEKNLNMPIVYGVGAGGITLDTTLVEAKTLLTIPIYGPDEGGQAYYREELVVIWKDEGDRKPQMIVPVGGYLGTMKAGKFGDLDYQTKFLTYKNDGAQGAARLTLELYIELEEVTDKSYNCLETGRCRLFYGDENQKNFVMLFPGAVFLMAKEEFQLAEIRIIRDVDPGILANNLDVLNGNIDVPEEAPFQLGATKAEIFERINQTAKSFPEVYVSTDSFTYAWNGVYFLFHRSNYANDVKEADDEDIHFATQVTPAYPAYLTIDGKRILMTQSPTDIRFDLEVMPDPATMELDEVNINDSTIESKLTMNTKVAKKDSLLFAQKLADFLVAQLSGEFENVRFRTWGIQNESKNNKDISISIEAFHNGSLEGEFVGFQVNQEQEKMDYIITGVMSPKISPFSKITLPPSKGNVERAGDVYTQLSGISLNDLVKLEEIDNLGRGEATVTYLSGDQALGEIKERAGYTEQGTFKEPLFNRPIDRDQGFISVAGALLGVQVVGQDEQGAQYARVVSVTSGNFYGQVQGLCGLGANTDLRISMKDEQVVAELDKAIAAQKVLDPKFECNHFRIYDDGALGLLKEIYFPDQNIKLSFSNRAFSGVSIYMPLAAVEPMPEPVSEKQPTVEVSND